VAGEPFKITELAFPAKTPHPDPLPIRWGEGEDLPDSGSWVQSANSFVKDIGITVISPQCLTFASNEQFLSPAFLSEKLGKHLSAIVEFEAPIFAKRKVDSVCSFVLVGGGCIQTKVTCAPIT
jgi:hypothetical protein